MFDNPEAPVRRVALSSSTKASSGILKRWTIVAIGLGVCVAGVAITVVAGVPRFGMVFILVGLFLAVGAVVGDHGSDGPHDQSLAIDGPRSEIRIERARGESVRYLRSAIVDATVARYVEGTGDSRRARYRVALVKADGPIGGEVRIGAAARSADAHAGRVEEIRAALAAVPANPAIEGDRVAEAWERLQAAPRVVVGGTAPHEGWNPESDHVEVTLLPDRRPAVVGQAAVLFGGMAGIIIAFILAGVKPKGPLDGSVVGGMLAAMLTAGFIGALYAARRARMQWRVRIDGFMTRLATDKDGVEVDSKRWQTAELAAVDCFVGNRGMVERLSVRERKAGALAAQRFSEMETHGKGGAIAAVGAMFDGSFAGAMGTKIDLDAMTDDVGADVEAVLDAAISRVNARTQQD